jgi:hypothetical protein
MGDTLYGRRCKLVISIPVSTSGDYSSTTYDQVEINGSDDANNPGLRIRFKVTKTREKDPNVAEITVTNLSETRRGSLQVKGVKVAIEAGYAATGLSRLFLGDARTIDHSREGADWQTTIKAGDGERGLRFARVNESFAAGTTAGQILTRLANASGLQVGNVPSQVPKLSTRFDQGWVAHGKARAEIGRLLRSLGYRWSVQDGQLQVLARGETLEQLIPEISSTTGLVGSPEMGSPEKKGQAALIRLVSLLTPVRPGGKVRLKSSRYDGEITLKRVEHDGDTAGGPWYSAMEGTGA